MKKHKKLIVIFVLIIVILSIILYFKNIKKEEHNYVPDILNAIDNLSYTNYSYDYEIKEADEVFKYNGTIYDYINKGVFSHQDNSINYQIESDTCYNIDNKEEITNVFYNVNIKYIYFEYLKKEIDDAFTKCSLNSDVIECTNKDRIMNFKIDDNYIKSIYIKDNDNTYNLNYSDINNVDRLYSINESVLKITYDEVDNIKSTKFDDKELIFYKIFNVKYKDFRFGRITDTKLDNFLYKALGKAKKKNSTKYIYPNDLIIYVSDNNGKVYVSLEKYDKDLQEKIDNE